MFNQQKKKPDHAFAHQVPLVDGTYPVDTVGVADSWDGFGFKDRGRGWSRAGI